MKPLAAGFFSVLAVTHAVPASAVDLEQRCHRVAAVAVAEIKANATEPMSVAALIAARDGAIRGCMASLATPATTAVTRADASAAIDGAAAEAPAKPATGGLFECLTREPKRTKGNKRLQQRGKY